MSANVWTVVGPNNRQSVKNWLQEVRGYHRGQTPVQPGHHQHLPLLQHKFLKLQGGINISTWKLSVKHGHFCIFFT